MYITGITVTVHEKRNHPHEYGHRDAEVSLVAQIAPTDHIDVVIEQLRFAARLHVETELNKWLENIEYMWSQQEFFYDVRQQIADLRWHSSRANLESRYVQIKDKLAESRFDVVAIQAELDTAKSLAATRIAEQETITNDF